MVPETFEPRDALRKTSTGKIDRQTLAKEALAAAEAAAPTSGGEG
jgi:hypothetical protein